MWGCGDMWGWVPGEPRAGLSGQGSSRPAVPSSTFLPSSVPTPVPRRRMRRPPPRPSGVARRRARGRRRPRAASAAPSGSPSCPAAGRAALALLEGKRLLLARGCRAAPRRRPSPGTRCSPSATSRRAGRRCTAPRPSPACGSPRCAARTPRRRKPAGSSAWRRGGAVPGKERGKEGEGGAERVSTPQIACRMPHGRRRRARLRSRERRTSAGPCERSPGSPPHSASRGTAPRAP